jgi:hypothetical protein
LWQVLDRRIAQVVVGPGRVAAGHDAAGQPGRHRQPDLPRDRAQQAVEVADAQRIAFHQRQVGHVGPEQLARLRRDVVEELRQVTGGGEARGDVRQSCEAAGALRPVAQPGVQQQSAGGLLLGIRDAPAVLLERLDRDVVEQQLQPRRRNNHGASVAGA